MPEYGQGLPNYVRRTSRLRDAAVDPKPTDFLPPTNAGEADPHGPLVVAPEIHHDGPKGLKPGVVHVGDPDKQEADETALAEAVLVENQDKVEAVAEADDDAGEAPSSNASKAAWVDYAVSQGADRDEAEELSRRNLIEQYG